MLHKSRAHRFLPHYRWWYSDGPPSSLPLLTRSGECCWLAFSITDWYELPKSAFKGFFSCLLVVHLGNQAAVWSWPTQVFLAGAVYSILGCAYIHSFRSEWSTLGLPSLEGYQSFDYYQTKYSETEHGLLGVQMPSRINLPPENCSLKWRDTKSTSEYIAEGRQCS